MAEPKKVVRREFPVALLANGIDRFLHLRLGAQREQIRSAIRHGQPRFFTVSRDEQVEKRVQSQQGGGATAVFRHGGSRLLLLFLCVMALSPSDTALVEDIPKCTRGFFGGLWEPREGTVVFLFWRR